MNLDHIARQVLMSAYLYYQRDENVLSDAENDNLVITLLNNWNDIPKRYLPLLDPDKIGVESIKATTHHCLYTRQVEGGALAWLKEKTGKELRPLGHGYYNLTKEEIMTRYNHKDHEQALETIDAMLYSGSPLQESEYEELVDIFGRWENKAKGDLADLRESQSISLEDMF